MPLVLNDVPSSLLYNRKMSLYEGLITSPPSLQFFSMQHWKAGTGPGNEAKLPGTTPSTMVIQLTLASYAVYTEQ